MFGRPSVFAGDLLYVASIAAEVEGGRSGDRHRYAGLVMEMTGRGSVIDASSPETQQEARAVEESDRRSDGLRRS